MEQEARSESQGSEALQIFEAHSNNVRYLLRGMLRDVEQINDPIDRLHELIANTAGTVKNLKKGISESIEPNNGPALEHISTNQDVLNKHLDEIRAMVQANVQVHPFLFDWMLAMMVTLVEAYLENVLLILTTTHPEWMATNDKVVSGDDVLKIEAALPTEKRWQGLIEILRQRWTARFLRGTPGEWISRLEKFGAPKYPADLGEKMTTIWHRRHTIVHASPAVRPDHVTGLSESPVTRYIQSKSAFKDATSVICGKRSQGDAGGSWMS
jgi:hypothetical protein